jgi:hypothetical protein
MEIKITVMKIKLGETELELSADDAKKLYDELHKIYGTTTINFGAQDGGIFGPTRFAFNENNKPNNYEVKVTNGQ